MNASEFIDWAKAASVGSRTIYHTGLLMLDRQVGAGAGRKNDLAREVMSAEACGRVHLVQRRLGNGSYEYIAERSRNDPRFNQKRRGFLRARGVHFERH